MPCFHPLRAFKTAAGDVVFSELRRFDVIAQLSLPCGQCVGCRLERSRQWAVRCMHESSAHSQNAFITLTYDDAHLPPGGSLRYGDFQKFMKRLRKVVGPQGVRFYMCGEYGDLEFRPHFHACLFGYDFPDKVMFKSTGSGSKIFTSAILERLWPFGLSSTADVTFESAAYVARYCMKKITGKGSSDFYRRVDPDSGEIFDLVPEFNKMSLKPGIGANWYSKFRSDVYPHDYVVVRGKECKPPKYYDKLYAKEFPEKFEDLQFIRELDGRFRFPDNTDERLAVKEAVAIAGLNQFKRS